ncbi:MAG TPA: pilus assembly PilX N-terminal domain-containing protein [Thermoanaerobaculia bacterium]
MTTHRTLSRAEAGSAYIVTLLALVVLTILALSLALVTQTEVQVGANEKTVNRTFYAADSGLGIAAAEALSSGRYTGLTVILNRISVGNANIADRVTITSFVPILTVRCDWCPANANGVPKFWKVNHAVTATSERISWTGGGAPPADATLLGQKTLSAMFEFQPWPTPPVESIPTDAATLAKVKF